MPSIAVTNADWPDPLWATSRPDDAFIASATLMPLCQGIALKLFWRSPPKLMASSTLSCGTPFVTAAVRFVLCSGDPPRRLYTRDHTIAASTKPNRTGSRHHGPQTEHVLRGAFSTCRLIAENG